jgi:hypothetical protein
LAVAVAVVAAVAHTKLLLNHHLLSRLITAAAAAAEAEQEPLTLQVELAALAPPGGLTAALAELAQAELEALGVVAQAALLALAELVAVGVQQVKAVLSPTSTARALEAQLAQPSQAIQTLLITPLAHV